MIFEIGSEVEAKAPTPELDDLKADDCQISDLAPLRKVRNLTKVKLDRKIFVGSAFDCSFYQSGPTPNMQAEEIIISIVYKYVPPRASSKKDRQQQTERLTIALYKSSLLYESSEAMDIMLEDV